MTVHDQSNEYASKNVRIKEGVVDPVQGAVVAGALYRVEDWYDLVVGRSWMNADGNPGAMQYAIRSAANGLPLDDEVLYGKIGALVHVTEIEEVTQ